MIILVTGAAGFIGFHVAQRLLQQGHHVIGIDNLNDYYAVTLKQDRLAQLQTQPEFTFHEMDITAHSALNHIFEKHPQMPVIHLAAQAGVRHSMTHPAEYIQSNIVGFANILECCRQHQSSHLLFASSSSVYGANTKQPYAESDCTDHPVSLYGATKKSNEILAHSYAHLFQLPCTGLRFFTVYGPWGRPDMSPMLFARSILAGEPINVFNHGNMQRDFTYIDDIVTSIVKLITQPAAASDNWNSAQPQSHISDAPYRIYNIGNNQTIPLREFIAAMEEALGKSAIWNLLPMQAGDVVSTYADSQALSDAIAFTPSTTLPEGLARFVAWYRDYYRL